MTTLAVTEQLTPSGQAIEHASFAIVDAEAGAHDHPPAHWAVVRRLIHASADFEFARLTRFHDRAIAAGLAAIRRGGTPIVVDVEMIRAGLSAPRLAHFGLRAHQFTDAPQVIDRARAEHTTRAVQAMRHAHALGLLDGAIVGIGNAPTALLELLRLIGTAGARPALVLGMPVGFVQAAESKARLAELTAVPWILIEGRKGGSTLVVAALHALLALAALPTATGNTP